DQKDQGQRHAEYPQEQAAAEAPPLALQSLDLHGVLLLLEREIARDQVEDERQEDHHLDHAQAKMEVFGTQVAALLGVDDLARFAHIHLAWNVRRVSVAIGRAALHDGRSTVLWRDYFRRESAARRGRRRPPRTAGGRSSGGSRGSDRGPSSGRR